MLVQAGTPTPSSSDWVISDTAGNTWTGSYVTSLLQTGSGVHWAGWAFVITGCKSGANSVSAELNASGVGGIGVGGYTDIQVIEYAASTTGGGLRASGTGINAGGSANVPNVTLTGTSSGDVCVQFFNVSNGSGLSTKGSFGANTAVDLVQSTDGGAPWSFQDGTGDGSGSMSCTCGTSQTEWISIAFALKPSGGASVVFEDGPLEPSAILDYGTVSLAQTDHEDALHVSAAPGEIEDAATEWFSVDVPAVGYAPQGSADELAPVTSPVFDESGPEPIPPTAEPIPLAATAREDELSPATHLAEDSPPEIPLTAPDPIALTQREDDYIPTLLVTDDTGTELAQFSVDQATLAIPSTDELSPGGHLVEDAAAVPPLLSVDLAPLLAAPDDSLPPQTSFALDDATTPLVLLAAFDLPPKASVPEELPSASVASIVTDEQATSMPPLAADPLPILRGVEEIGGSLNSPALEEQGAAFSPLLELQAPPPLANPGEDSPSPHLDDDAPPPPSLLRDATPLTQPVPSVDELPTPPALEESNSPAPWVLYPDPPALAPRQADELPMQGAAAVLDDAGRLVVWQQNSEGWTPWSACPDELFFISPPPVGPFPAKGRIVFTPIAIGEISVQAIAVGRVVASPLATGVIVSDIYNVFPGDLSNNVCTIVDASGNVQDPGAVTATVLQPNGVQVALTVTRLSQGVYEAPFQWALPGIHFVKFVGTAPFPCVTIQNVQIAAPTF
jgi:hypothetical protein